MSLLFEFCLFSFVKTSKLSYNGNPAKANQSRSYICLDYKQVKAPHDISYDINNASPGLLQLILCYFNFFHVVVSQKRIVIDNVNCCKVARGSFSFTHILSIKLSFQPTAVKFMF